VEPLPETEGGLNVYDVSLVPSEPDSGLIYRHRPRLLASAAELLRRGEVIFTLAERDIRAQYKQAFLGVGWALLTPLVSLAVLVLLVNHVKSFSIGGQVPTILTVYVGLLTWGFFGGAVGGGSNSLVSNKSLMAKSHFPRECFPMSQVLGSAFTSLMATVPLAVLFAITAFPPKPTTVWVPLYIAIEVPVTVGIVLLVSSVIVQMRDLQQIVPILMPLAMIITVIKPLSVEMHHQLVANPAAFVHGWGRIAYCVINPMAPIIDNVRASVLLGFGPQVDLLVPAIIGSIAYLCIGYVVFKKLEVNFADLT
jgi:ABC-type polysaccharide/polyol phosphate export permease